MFVNVTVQSSFKLGYYLINDVQIRKLAILFEVSKEKCLCYSKDYAT